MPLRSLLAICRHLSLPYARRNRGRVALVLIAVSLGVSTIVASGTLVKSAIGSLETTWSLDTNADLRVANGFVGVGEGLLEPVRAVPGVATAEGLLVEVARARLASSLVDLQIFGIDIFGPGEVYQGFERSDESTIDDVAFMTRLNAIALPSDFAAAHGLEIGSTFEADTRVARKVFYVAGLIPPGRTSRALGGAIGVMDLPAAQQTFGRVGLLDAINILVAEGADTGVVRADLAEISADRATVSAVGSSQPELASLLFNLRLILHTIGALALIVGALIIYNAIEMMASERRSQIDLIWTLGASRRMLASLLTAEALVIAAVGIAIGTAAGFLLARLAYDLFGQAVSTLYVPIIASQFDFSMTSAVAGATLAVVLTLLASLRTAVSAGGGASALSVASPRGARWRQARILAGIGVCLIVTGLVVPVFYGSAESAEALAALLIAADIPVLLGIGLVAPVALMALTPRVANLLSRSASPVLRLALLGLTADPGRSAAVMASVLISVANVVNSAGMIGSMRTAVVEWVRQSQRADLVVSAAGAVPFLASAPPISSALANELRGIPSIQSVDTYRLVSQPYEDRWVVIAARDPATYGLRQPVTLVEGDLPSALQALRAGTGVILSQHMATMHDLAVGDTLELRTPTGKARFGVAGIVVDYSGDLGTVIVASDVFREKWRDSGATGIQVWLKEGADTDRARDAVAAALAPLCDCAVLAQSEFRARSDAVIDASFSTMYALQLVASAVMVVAILAFFSISLSERRNQIQTLRSIGATRRQIVLSVLWEAGILSAVGASLGCLACIWLGRRLVEEGMRAAGGMVIEFVIPTDAMVLTLGVCTVAGLLASLGPALSASSPPTDPR